MNQSAWTEGLVNRVMYLSSQNLKSADIQLEPAELGASTFGSMWRRTSHPGHFISGHAGVREALDSQVHRLRDCSPSRAWPSRDVNVADQSRGQQQQQAQQGFEPVRGGGAPCRCRRARVVNWLMPASRWSSRWWWATARSTTTPDRRCRPLRGPANKAVPDPLKPSS
jgi:hypothetical protein